MTEGACILIADDEPAGRDTLEGLLLGQGYRLAFATNGLETLAKAAELTPDLILLDVMMPGMDGFEVCRRLRAEPHLAEVPVILVTALNDRDARVYGIEAGADDFVSKPFDRVELRARVRNVARLNRYRRLLAERARFEWVVEQADDGYLIVNDGDDVLYSNARARLYLGLRVDDRSPISEAFLTLARRQYRFEPQDAWAVWPDPAAGQTPRYLVRPATQTAAAFWLQVQLLAMMPGSHEQTLVRLRDVTASVIQRSYVWSFEAQVSHKLRSPLGLLNGFLDVLDEDLPALPKEQQTLLLSLARENAVELRERILDVLQYLEARDIVARGADRCSLDEIASIAATLQADLELPSVDVQYEAIDDPSHTRVPMSRHALELILFELLENAKKFHPRRAPAVQMRVSGLPDNVRIQVSDDGLTLALEQLARIWTPYYQAERDFTGQVPGMGLGLPTVAALVWGVGGTCRAYNHSDRVGVVVELVLPAVKVDQGPNG